MSTHHTLTVAKLTNYGKCDSATFSVTFRISLYLHYTSHLMPQQVANTLIAQPVTQAAISPFARRLSDRIEPCWLASFGMSLGVAGFFLLTILHASFSIAFIVTSLVLLGRGFGLFSSPNTNVVIGAVGKQVYGVASAIPETMHLLGQKLSSGMALLLFSLFIGYQPITFVFQDVIGHVMHLVFEVSVLLCLGGIFAALARGIIHEHSHALQSAARPYYGRSSICSGIS